ncbi:15809_t:CDS:2, partial [Dentiscutata erythropus]
GLLEAVEEYRIEDWIAKCIQYMVNKTIDEKQPIFIGMAQSVTKVLDKMEWPVICAKDQTKIAEMIEVDRCHARFVGCVQMQQTSIPYSMTIDELQQKLKTLKKATYITVFAILAVIPGIPPLVIANWLGRMYFTNYEFQNKLGLVKESESILLKKFPLDLHLCKNKLLLLSGTDFYHCIKKGHNMHNSDTHIVPIGNYVMSTEHLWQLYIIYGGKSGLTTDVLNPKDKQSDELTERFYSSHILRAIFEHAEKYNNDTFYGDHIFGYARRLIEDFTLLDFLMINEKIMKNIDIEMKGSIKYPGSNDSYNIRLGSIKDSLDSELSLFPTEFEIGNILEKVSIAMHEILKSVGIDFSYHKYIQIIRECFNCQHNFVNHEDEFLDENEEVESVLIMILPN